MHLRSEVDGSRNYREVDSHQSNKHAQRAILKCVSIMKARLHQQAFPSGIGPL